MAFFDFLKKGKKEEREGFEEIIPPPPRPRIEDIPSFPFEREELLPPIKPVKTEITPLEEQEEALEEEEAPSEEELKFIPKPPKPEKYKPKPVKKREEIVIEEPIFEREIRPEPFAKPVTPPRPFTPPKVVGEGFPYVRVYKFKEMIEDLNQIARSLRKVPTRIKSKNVEEAYEEFERSLDVVMKRIDSIERSIFE